MAIDRTPVRKRANWVGINPIVLGYEGNKGKEKEVVRRRKKSSEYALQLKEKQKVKFVYGLLEKQFVLTYKRAERMSGMTGSTLLVLLESRLDNAIFRMGFAKTRKMARQMINHGHVFINEKRVDIPSYKIKIGEKITLQKSIQNKVREFMAPHSRSVPSWLRVDKDSFSGTITSLPKRDDVDFDVVESRIVELYSK
ncbi:MAG: 30S ribosomal protein S4 [Spirochaetia bacterium]|nr:30S ribosomal protein S4 [Spirochaetia bacterium]